MSDLPVNSGSPEPLEPTDTADSPEAPQSAPLEAEPVNAPPAAEAAPSAAAPDDAAPGEATEQEDDLSQSISESADNPVEESTASPVSEPPAPAAEPAPMPEPPPAPVEVPVMRSTPAASAPVDAPAIAASLEAPPQPAIGGETGEGGEWDLLVGKLLALLEGDQLRDWWNRLSGPLRTAGLLFALVLVLRLYEALLETLGDLPLVPRLLQLVGLITVARFALTRLVRTEDRQSVIDDLKGRWQRFRGGA